MDYHKELTVQSYRQNANAHAAKFDAIGPRVADIKEAFGYVKTPNPAVFEIGCGNGRDASEIRKRTDRYIGLDISEELVELARKKVPDTVFVVGDIETYAIPSGIDIAIAFASLIHVPRNVLRDVLSNVYHALNPGGILYLSLKEHTYYKSATRRDEFGTRTYYLYPEEDLRTAAPPFSFAKFVTVSVRGKDWHEIILKK